MTFLSKLILVSFILLKSLHFSLEESKSFNLKNEVPANSTDVKIHPKLTTQLQTVKKFQEDGDEDGDGENFAVLAPYRPTVPPKIGLLPQVGYLVGNILRGNQNFGANLTSFVGSATKVLPGELGPQVLNVFKILVGDDENNKRQQAAAQAAAVEAMIQQTTLNPLIAEINILAQFSKDELKLLADSGNLNHISPEALLAFGVSLKTTTEAPKVEKIDVKTTGIPTLPLDYEEELEQVVTTKKPRFKLRTSPKPTYQPEEQFAEVAAPVPSIKQATIQYINYPTNLLEPGQEPKPYTPPTTKWKEVPGSPSDFANFESYYAPIRTTIRPTTSNPLLSNVQNILDGQTGVFEGGFSNIVNNYEKQQQQFELNRINSNKFLPEAPKTNVPLRRKPQTSQSVAQSEQAKLQAEQLALIQQQTTINKINLIEEDSDNFVVSTQKPEILMQQPQLNLAQQIMQLSPAQLAQLQLQLQAQSQLAQGGLNQKPQNQPQFPQQQRQPIVVGYPPQGQFPPYYGGGRPPPPRYPFDEDEDSEEGDLGDVGGVIDKHVSLLSK